MITKNLHGSEINVQTNEVKLPPLFTLATDRQRILQGRIQDFLKWGDLGAAEAHLRAPFMRCAHKGCESSGSGGLGAL